MEEWRQQKGSEVMLQAETRFSLNTLSYQSMEGTANKGTGTSCLWHSYSRVIEYRKSLGM